MSIENAVIRCYYLGMKKLLIMLLLLTGLPSFAGVYEDALKGNDYVLLYLHTSYCKTCKLMEPYFDKTVKSHNNLKGVKVDAQTAYGSRLMYKFNGRHVPYIVMSSPKGKKSVTIEAGCLIDEVCIERVLKGLK